MNYPIEYARNALALAVLAAIFPARAQQADNTNQAHVTTLENIVITGVAPTSPVTIVTDPKLPRQPLPASDGTDYLTTIPGFSAIRNGGSNGDPVLRGMFGSRLNILTNGGNMIGACPSRMDAPSSYISPETFDRLTVIKGPQTVLWGPGASAGTVRFDREPPGFTEAGFLADASLMGGSWGRNDQAVDMTVGNERIYGRVGFNHSHAQDYKDGDGNVVPSRWDKWNADVALGFTPDADSYYEISAGTGDGEARYAGRGMDGTQFRRESAAFRFRQANLGDVFTTLEGQVYYNYADHVMNNYTLRQFKPGGGMNHPMASNVDRRTQGGRLAATLALSDTVSMIAGMDFMDSDHRARSKMGAMPYSPWTQDANFSNVGVFGELTWKLAPHQRIVGGARLDHASTKDMRSVTGMRGMQRLNPTANERRSDTLPSGFVRYEHDLQSLPATLYAGIGHVQRFPDYWELFSPKMGPSGARNAFDGIKPEKTTQIDIGAQYKTDTVEAWVSAYAGTIADYILFDYMPGGMMGSISRARNVDARIMGGELGGSWRVSPSWKLGGSLAYAWGKNQSDSRPMAQIPPLEVSLNAQYEQGPWSAGAVWRLVASQHRYAVNQGNVVGKDFGPSAGFGVLSLNAGYAFDKRASLAIGVDNVFDKTYTEHLNLLGNSGFGYSGTSPFNEPGRTVWARVSFRF